MPAVIPPYRHNCDKSALHETSRRCETQFDIVVADCSQTGTRENSMTTALKLTGLAAALGLAALSAPAAYAAEDWETLGCRTVNFTADRDTVPVGKADGQFKRLRLRVKDAPIEFSHIRVVFGNGKDQEIAIEQKVAADSVSSPIDLDGKSRGIEEVRLVYKSVPTFKGTAEVCVDGRPN